MLKGGERPKACPQGDCTYDRPPRRARDLEAMIENSHFTLSCCKPECLVEMKKGDVDAHETSCIFRKVPCPDMSCQKEVLTYMSLDVHIREKNSTVLEQAILKPTLNERIMMENDRKWDLSIYREAGFEFYPTFVKQDGLWYFWIKMKTDKLSAANWSYHVKSENVELGMLVEFTGSVQPVDLGLNEIIESGQYMFINKHTVMKLKTRASDKSVKNGYPHMIRFSFKLFKKL